MSRYALALGSNRRHGRHGAPANVLKAAIRAIEAEGLVVETPSTIRSTPALGPAGRGFANAAIVISTDVSPPELLQLLKSIERGFGRRAGRRWGPRVLDLDIVLWSQGCWEDADLVVPHPAFRDRLFVLEPVAEIAADWRDPVSGASMRQLLAKLAARRPVDPHAARS